MDRQTDRPVFQARLDRLLDSLLPASTISAPATSVLSSLAAADSAAANQSLAARPILTIELMLQSSL